MELQEIANCIAATETSLLSGFARHIDFRAGEMMCRVTRSDSGIRYYRAIQWVLSRVSRWA